MYWTQREWMSLRNLRGLGKRYWGGVLYDSRRESMRRIEQVKRITNRIELVGIERRDVV